MGLKLRFLAWQETRFTGDKDIIIYCAGDIAGAVDKNKIIK